MCVRFPIILVKLTSLRGSLSPDLRRKVMEAGRGPCAGKGHVSPMRDRQGRGKSAPAPLHLLLLFLCPRAQSHGKIPGPGGWFGLILCWCPLAPSVTCVVFPGWLCTCAWICGDAVILGRRMRLERQIRRKGTSHSLAGLYLQGVCVCVYPCIPLVCSLSTSLDLKPNSPLATGLHFSMPPTARMLGWASGCQRLVKGRNQQRSAGLPPLRAARSLSL